MRPQPWTHLKKIPTVWMDFATGRGVTSDGTPVVPKVGRGRKNPNLVDKLDTVAALDGPPIKRIMLTGKVPKAEEGQRHWLLTQTPGWKAKGHWVSAPVTGRFEREATDQYVEIRTAAEWFGDTPLTASQARLAWDAVEERLSRAFADSGLTGSPMMLSPAGTGTNLWAISMPKNLDPELISDDIAEELHATSGQHHLEHLVAGPDQVRHPDCLPLIDPAVTGETIEKFVYTDGRFMYGSLCRELGTGPGVRLNQTHTEDLLHRDSYARARIYARFQVPEDWHHVGILGCQMPTAAEGWYYPNRPGAIGETWADSAEISVALQHGWKIEPLESVVFNKTMPSRTGAPTAARPMDLFAHRLVRAREDAAADPDLPPLLASAIGAALRAIMIQTIGAFASRGRARTMVVYDHTHIPPQYMGSMTRQGQAYVYKIPQEHTTRQRGMYRPEYAAQIWGRGRAKVLHHRVANTDVGALTVDPATLIGINGDALYTTVVPRWAAPVEQGGLDDGKTGRLRLQGILPGPVRLPVTKTERDKLRTAAVKAGVDSAAFDNELDIPED